MRAASGGGDPNRAEAALAPPLGNPRFPLVDSMRAIAVIAIFLFHALDSKWTARLNVGVPLFFVISAFLLYRPFVAARYQDKPRIRTRDFLQRRVLRIVPAYWVAVLVILASIGAPAYAIDGYDKLGMYLLLVQNYRPETVLLLIPGAWSLCVEASFYLALPAYAAAAASWASGPRGFRRELWLLVAIAILSVTYRDILFATSGDTVFAWATLPATALWFALGMGAAVISVASEVDRRRSWVKRHILHASPALWWVLALALFVPLNLPFRAGGIFDPTHAGSPDIPLDSVRYLLFGLVAVCFFWPAVAGSRGRSRIVSFLGWRPLMWLGLVSYGVFLWHERVLDFFATRSPSTFFQVVFAAVVVIGVAAVSYYVIERPFLRRKRGISRRAPRAEPGSTTEARRQTAQAGA